MVSKTQMIPGEITARDLVLEPMSCTVPHLMFPSSYHKPVQGLCTISRRETMSGWRETPNAILQRRCLSAANEQFERISSSLNTLSRLYSEILWCRLKYCDILWKQSFTLINCGTSEVIDSVFSRQEIRACKVESHERNARQEVQMSDRAVTRPPERVWRTGSELWERWSGSS